MEGVGDKQLFDSVKKYCSSHNGTVDIEFSDLRYEVDLKSSFLPCAKTSRKVILSGPNGTFKHGQLHAIMGPSGAGKSTLLNVLVGFNQKVKGTILLNGTEYHPSDTYLSTISTVSSYILQDDFLLPELTVWETMYYASKFKLPTQTTDSERKKIIKKILHSIFMLEFAHRRIRFLSGGQLKRMSVAVELLNAKPVLFLDEPTTGLDSTSCLQLMKVLKAMAQTGTNVIAVIHQPNSVVYHLFDSLYVLAAGGRTAYSGSPIELPGALKNAGIICPLRSNVADVLFQKDNIPKLAEIKEQDFNTSYGDNVILLKHDQQIEEVMDNCASSRPWLLTQCSAHLSRLSRQAMRDSNFTIWRFISYIWIALILGNGFRGVGQSAHLTWANLGVLYNSISLNIVAAGLVALKRLETGFKGLLREDVNSWYSVSVYYWSKTLFEALCEVVFISFYAILIWFMTTQLQDPSFGYPLFVTFVALNSLIMQQLTYVICLFVTGPLAINIPYFLCLLQGVFGGFILVYILAPGYLFWMKNFWFFCYAYFGILKVAYSKTTTGDEIVIPCELGLHPDCARYNNGSTLLAAQSVDPTVSSVYEMKVLFFGWFLILVLVGWLCALWSIRQAKFSLARA